MITAAISSPSTNAFHVGPLMLRAYGLLIVLGIVVATWLTMRRWQARGGSRELVFEVGFWSVLAGVAGARLCHLVTSWNEVPDEWWGPFAIWKGGLGIWGGVLLGFLVGAWLVRRRGASVAAFADAAAPGLLIAQGIGRIGNYFNQELFGTPTDLPWALAIDPENRPDGYGAYETFHPTFLYEFLWDVGYALVLIWIGGRCRIRPGGIFALYVAGYSFARIFEELLRIDPAKELVGFRLNFYVATALFLASCAFFVWIPRRRVARPAP